MAVQQAGYDRPWKMVIYMDEMSTWLWERRARCFCPKNYKQKFSQKRNQGSITIIGALMSTGHFYAELHDTTNTGNVLGFFQELFKWRPQEVMGATVIIDNHVCYHANLVVDFLQDDL